MSGLSRSASELRREKQQLLEAMLELTEQATSTLSGSQLLDMLEERAKLIDRVAAIDARLDQMQAVPAPDEEQQRMYESLEAIVALNERLLVQLSGRRDNLFNEMLSSPRLPS